MPRPRAETVRGSVAPPAGGPPPTQPARRRLREGLAGGSSETTAGPRRTLDLLLVCDPQVPLLSQQTRC